MDEAYTVTALSPLRKVIAARMTEAIQTIPHFRLVAEIELDALYDVRAQLRKREPNGKVSLNTLLVKVCASALMEHPAINIQWSGSGIRYYRAADISVITAVEGGLSTPIIRNADSKSLWDIAGEMKELSARAAANALKMEEIAGGSFSISNLGMYGVDQFDAIINSPQCAILAVGRARHGVLVSNHDAPRIANVITATLSVDHRAIDGATGARFLSTLRQRMERPEYLLVDN